MHSSTQRAKERTQKKPVGQKGKPKPTPKKKVPYTNQHGSSKG